MSNTTGSRRRHDCGEQPDQDRNYDSVHVYCRIRPLPASSDSSNVIIKDPTTVVLTMAANTNRADGSQHRLSVDQETHYRFKHVFGPQCTQDEVFKVVAQPLVEKLILGSSSLLFTYGVTGSGKTYTMTGESRELGLMPRCLEALFRSIEGFHARKCVFQPDHLNGFEIISDTEALARQKMGKHHARNVLGQKIVHRMKAIESEYELNVLEKIAALPGVDERNVYAVFISYIEVYNNCVYDLLEECTVQRTLQSRMVREDSNHKMYVHGVTEIEIKSVIEALEAFQIGQKHKKIGHTVLNAESSRSHSVFNIRLVQAPIGEHSRENRQVITISQLSLVDLAGSERSSRTNNSGARLREAGNINNSLMTLRSCLEYLRENQRSATAGGAVKKIPYRDSKITQLFKNYFEGEGHVSMIACINPRPEDYAENSQVMRFAELTQEIQVPRPETTVQISSNENEIINLLRQRFFGYEFEIPPGDGPLSEKLIFVFQQYLEKSKKTTTQLERQCEQYRREIVQVEKKNSELQTKLDQEHNEVQELKSTVQSYRETLAILRKSLDDHTMRIDQLEDDLRNRQSASTSAQRSQEATARKDRSADDARIINELIAYKPSGDGPKKVNLSLIRKFIELTERDEI